MNPPTFMSTHELERLMHAGSAPAIIDVRSAYEFRHGHIPGATHLPFWKSFFLAHGLSAPKDRPVVVYCQHGPRAIIGKLALQRAGYADVRYLDGHMSAWQRAGLPMEPVSRK
jgi:rhodanese-related sulfurtransferase